MSDQSGYTRIPNALLELLPTLHEAELRVLLVIIRKTAGWQKECDVISQSQLTSATGMSKQGVINGIERLLEQGLITREPAKNNGFCYQVVNEVDSLNKQSTKLTSQRSRQQVVNEVDSLGPQVVNEVDTQKKESKERKERDVAPRAKRGRTPLKTPKETTPLPVIQSLADICLIDRTLATKADHIILADAAGALYKAGRDHGKTDDEIIAAIRYFAEWFSRKDFRGQKGEAPTPQLVRRLWPQAIEARRNNGHAPGAPVPPTVAAALNPPVYTPQQSRREILAERARSREAGKS